MDDFQCSHPSHPRPSRRNTLRPNRQMRLPHPHRAHQWPPVLPAAHPPAVPAHPPPALRPQAVPERPPSAPRPPPAPGYPPSAPRQPPAPERRSPALPPGEPAILAPRAKRQPASQPAVPGQPSAPRPGAAPEWGCVPAASAASPAAAASAGIPPCPWQPSSPAPWAHSPPFWPGADGRDAFPERPIPDASGRARSIPALACAGARSNPFRAVAPDPLPYHDRLSYCVNPSLPIYLNESMSSMSAIGQGKTYTPYYTPSFCDLATRSSRAKKIS